MTRRPLAHQLFVFAGWALMAWPAVAQTQPPVSHSLEESLAEFVSTPAVSGYESGLGDRIRVRAARIRSMTDTLGDVIVTLGSGSPRRLIVTPIDEPGFVASDIAEDGYIRVQRLPQFGLPPILNELYSAQPVRVETRSGKWIDGVVAGLSVHLQPGRLNAPKLSDVDSIFVDIGARSAAEARRAGVDNLSPIAINRRLFNLAGREFAGAAVGDRFGAAALAELFGEIDPSKLKGTLTVAFVVQQWAGARGFERVLSTNQFDEMVYVGRLLPGGPVPGSESVRRAPRREPGSGVLIGLAETDGQLEGLPADLRRLADDNGIPIAVDYSSAVVSPSYLAQPAFPARWAHLGVATAWPDTPAEEISSSDLAALAKLLDLYVGARRAGDPAGLRSQTNQGSGEGGDLRPGPSSRPTNTEILAALTPVYGVSNHEGPVREEVKKLLPGWAKPETDEAGNLVLQVGTAPASAKTPSLLVVAHLDEIGYEVTSISNDGRLEVVSLGGGEPSFFLGHPALVHSAGGDHDAVMELPNGWEDPKFEWPRGRNTGGVIRVDVGARTPEEVATLGIKVGDTVTIPKAYRPLLNTCANGRSFDDRVGDTALISAAWVLGGPLKDRNVTFVFSTAEEIGLDGAAAVAKRLAAEGRAPDYVFAVDTFVSSDSPLESKRFADAPLGSGFVIRAVDNSNIVRADLVERVIKLARANQIPVQFGVTGGGNDGATFLRYGSLDVALGWPLRYSHSPAEVIDTRDVDSLARIITVVTRSW
ncbi:MAG TPA: M20/M25/M40 family metallo-hydrolase [Candidatus Cybelea sp.]|nr:M20/M25/M40 family metallo-hydrolase [Candidatus Cybelea sp.]